jgi:hypothetical protein
MDRKEFLKSCACGLCACAAASLIPSAELCAAEPAKPNDWRLPFVQKRYAKLLELLSGRMDEKAINELLLDLGADCSSSDDKNMKKFRGDPEGYRKAAKKSSPGDDIIYDWENGVITMAGGERSECSCPLVSIHAHTPKVVCNCTLGWQQHTWENILQKKVKVELKESVMRGDKRCVCKIYVGEKLPNAPEGSKPA